MHYVVMGVSGCGKSSIGAGFAAAIGGTFIDGDDLHPASNVAKMAAGMPLTDDDRAPWLRDVGATFQQQSGDVVIGCSALKRAYRDIIRDAAGGPVTFLHLHGEKAVIAARMSAREDHFMPTALLDSQFATLEMPERDEAAITVDIDQTPTAIVESFVAYSKSTR
jgi:gluconokinase